MGIGSPNKSEMGGDSIQPSVEESVMIVEKNVYEAAISLVVSPTKKKVEKKTNSDFNQSLLDFA